ncbi:hypothetical protein ACJ41O_005975 [Fusarium nematophilum]
MAKLKILICGGGIAGNAVAFWLSKRSHDVTVVERFPSLRDTGLQIDLRGFGIEVLKRMGLEKEFRARSVQEQGLEVVDSSGRSKAYFPANRTGQGLQSFTTDFEIMRGDLCRLLYDASKDRAKYVFGVSIERFEQHDGFVEVFFSDGKKDRFDLLVGADGQGSRTRRMLLGPYVDDPMHNLGVYIGYFTIPRPVQKGEEFRGTFYVAPGKRLVITRRHAPHTKQVYLISLAHSERMEKAQRGDVEQEKHALTDIFQGAGWEVDQVLEAMKDSDDFYCERLGLVRLDAWSSGRVVLVGDAAYCPSATTGMGTTSAIIGAYILAGEIEKHCGGPGTNDELLTALKEYDQKFRPFMAQVQHGITKDTSYWNRFPESRLAIAIFNFILMLAAMLRLDVFGKYFLREDVRDWSLPDYDGIVKGGH